MNTLNCKFFHPTGLEDFRMGHERKKPYSSQENPTELKNTRTFLEFIEGQKESLKEILRRLEQLELQKNQLQSPQK